jgi:hypothetical protein
MAATVTGVDAEDGQQRMLLDLLECPLCLSMFSQPISLSCGHTVSDFQM